MSNYFIGFDLGSHASKGIIIDSSGVIIASSSRKHNTATPHTGWQEQHADKIWWSDFKIIIKELMNESCINASDIQAIVQPDSFRDCVL